MAKRKNTFGLNQPLTHADHRRPMTRRELIAQGFRFGLGSVVGISGLNMLASNPAYAALSPELELLR